MPNKGQTSAQSGSAIVYVFIGIILFALLAFTFSKTSNQTSTSNLTAGQAKIAAQEIIAYSQSVQRSVEKLQSKGISENDMDFSVPDAKTVDGTSVTAMLDNPSCSTEECRVFSVQGGNAQPRIPGVQGLVSNEHASANWPGWAPLPGTMIAANFQVVGIGTTANEILVQFGGVLRDTCLAINELLNVDNPGGEPPVSDASTGTENFNGTFAGTVVVGDTETELEGKNAFCIEPAGNILGAEKYYVFYRVVMAR